MSCILKLCFCAHVCAVSVTNKQAHNRHPALRHERNAPVAAENNKTKQNETICGSKQRKNPNCFKKMSKIRRTTGEKAPVYLPVGECSCDRRQEEIQPAQRDSIYLKNESKVKAFSTCTGERVRNVGVLGWNVSGLIRTCC